MPPRMPVPRRAMTIRVTTPPTSARADPTRTDCAIRKVAMSAADVPSAVVAPVKSIVAVG